MLELPLVGGDFGPEAEPIFGLSPPRKHLILFRQRFSNYFSVDILCKTVPSTYGLSLRIKFEGNCLEAAGSNRPQDAFTASAAQNLGLFSYIGGNLRDDRSGPLNTKIRGNPAKILMEIFDRQKGGT
jgi:hypothetical protein